jgi:peptidoglycan/LPS O-acetylase OafA/YrhL
MPQNGTPATASAAQRGGALDALRFLAAAFVVLYHYGADAPVAVETLAPVLGRGWLATDFFVMLSGYVLGRAYGAGLDAGRMGLGDFFGRRLRRIWPAHLAVLAAFAVLVAAAGAAGIAPAHPERYGAGAFLAQAGLAHAWGFVEVPSWNVPSWTLSALVVCYAFFPLAWRSSRLLQGRGAGLLCAIDVLALTAVAGRLLFDRSPWDLPFQLGAIRALPIFLCGLLLARSVGGVALKRGEAMVVAGGGLIALWLFQACARTDLTDLGSLAAIAFAVVGLDQVRGLKARWAEEGAALSFALFITHALAGAVWFGALHAATARFLMPEALRWVLWAGSLPFALAVAWAFDRWVDQPVQRALGRLAFRPRPATGSEPQPAPSA